TALAESANSSKGLSYAALDRSLFQNATTSVGLGIVTLSGLLARSLAARNSSRAGDLRALILSVTVNGISTWNAWSASGRWNWTVHAGSWLKPSIPATNAS